MIKPEMDFYETRGNSMSIALLCSAGAGVFIYHYRTKLLEWSPFYPDILTALPILFFLLLAAYGWLRFFYRVPVIKIPTDGLLLGNGIALFERHMFIAWERINYFYLKEEKGRTSSLRCTSCICFVIWLSGTG